MADGLPKLEELKKKPLPKASELKKKEPSEPTESPSTTAQSVPSLGSQEETPQAEVNRPDWVVLNVKEAETAPLENLKGSIEYYLDFYKDAPFSQVTESGEVSLLPRGEELKALEDIYNKRIRTEGKLEDRIVIANSDVYQDFIKENLSNGLLNEEEISLPQNEIFELVASRITDKSFAEQDLSWGPVGFRQETETEPQMKQRYNDLNRKNIIKKIAEETKERILSQIPEDQKTPEQLEKVEERLWVDKGIKLDLTGDKRYGSGNNWVYDAAIAFQKETENIALSLAALGMEGSSPYASSQIRDIRKSEMERLGNKLTQIEGDISDNLAEGNLMNAASLTMQQVGSALPLMAATAATGGAAAEVSLFSKAGLRAAAAPLATLSGITGVTQYQEVRDEDWFKNNLNDAQKLGYLAAYGFAEGTDTLIGGRILKQAARQGATAASAGAREWLKDFFIGMGYNVGEEALSEGITGVIQYTVDEAARGNDVTFDGILDAFKRNAVAGAAGGAVMGGTPRLAAKGWSLALRTPEFIGMKNAEKKIIEDIQNTDNEAELEVLTVELEQIQQTRANLFKNQKALIDSMSEEDANAYAEDITNFNAYRERLSEMDEKSNAYQIAEKKAQEFLEQAQDIKAKYEGVQKTEAFRERERDEISEQDTQLTENQQDNAVQISEATALLSEPETQPVQEVEGQVRGEQEGTQATQEESQGVILKYNPTKTPKEFSDVEGGSRVFKEASGVFNKALDRRQGEETATQDAISYIQGTKAYENANDIQREEMIRSFRSEIGIKEKRAPSSKKVLAQPKAPTKAYTNTQITRLAEQVDKLGIREGIRQGRIKEKEFTNAVNEILKDVPEGEMKSTQAAILSKRAKEVKTPSQLKNFLQYADKVMNDAEYAKQLREADKIREKIQRLAKQKNKPSNITSFAKEFSAVDPAKVPDIGQYLLYAERVLNLERKPKKGEESEVMPLYVSVNEIREEYLDKYNNLSDSDLKQSILSDYNDLVEQGVIDDTMTTEELNQVVDGIYTEEEVDGVKGDKNINALTWLVDFKLKEVEQMPTDGLSDKAKEQLDFLYKIDLEKDNLSRRELASLYAALENYIYNGKLNNIASITARIYSSEAYAELDKYFEESGNLPKKWVSNWRNMVLGSMNMTQVLEALRGSSDSASRIYEKSKLYEYSAKKAVAENRLSQKVKDYRKRFLDRESVKLREAVTNIEDRVDRSIYGFLSQIPSDKFKDALEYIDESIKYQLEGVNTREKEFAEAARKVFDSKYKGISSIDAVKLSKENLSIVDFFRDSFAEIKPEYFENAEIVHNRTLEDFENYLPFVSRAKSTRKADTDDTLEQPSSLLDKVILPNRSGATNKRKNAFNPNNRYMTFDFEQNMFAQYSNQLMDIETSFTIKQIAAFLRSPKSVEVFGDRGFRDAFFDRAKEYVNDSYKSNQMGSYEQLAFEVANYAANLSGRVALGGIDQSLKQFVPILANTAVNAGAVNTLDGVIALSKGEASELLSKTPVSRRAYTDQDTKRIYSSIPESERRSLKSRLSNILKTTDEFSETVMMYVIQHSDKVAAQASFLAYYKDFRGEDFKGFEEEGKNPNREALAFADLMINNTQNVNDIDQQARWLKVKTDDKTFSTIRKTMFPFISFRVNQIADELVQFSKLSGRNKKEAAKRIGGRILEQLIFETSRKAIYMMYGGGASVLATMLTGLEPEEEDENKLKQNAYSIGTATTLNLLPFYGIFGYADDLINEQSNKYYFFNILSPEDRKKYTGFISPYADEKFKLKKNQKGYDKWKKSGNAPMFVGMTEPRLDFGFASSGINPDLGALTIGAYNHINGFGAMYRAFNSIQSDDDYKYLTRRGEEIDMELTDEEKTALAIFSIMENTDMFIVNDIAKIGTKAKSKVFSAKFKEMYGD